MADYLNVSQFARAAGKSHTWIGKLTKTTLKPYVKQDGNRTVIDAAALKLFKEQENTDTESNHQLTKSEIKMQNKIAELESQKQLLETENSDLKQQLTSREREIEHLMQIRDTLTQQLGEKDTQINSLHQLLDQQQRLQLQTQLPMKTSWWSRFFSRKSNV